MSDPLTINDNPTISDTIVFYLNTTDINGCLSDPYKINNVTIYYVERDFVSGNLSEYTNVIYDATKLAAAESAKALACASPTAENILAAQQAQMDADNNTTSNTFYFNDSRPVHVVGNSDYPAWLSTDLGNAFLDHVDTGQFSYTWQPEGMREGDYFICWTWTPLIAGDSLSANQKFYLLGDTQVTTSIPTHYTDPEKYTTLLDRYTPAMFKMLICNNDRTPDVLEKLNQSIALGFNVLEDLTNQMVDLEDANSIHEALIPCLSNLFGLKLKTDDPTKWRGQIKRAVSLYKNKGTKSGLSEALDHAGITLNKLTQLWQTVSPYTWQELFTFDGTNYEFILEKEALDLDLLNFELWIRPVDQSDWVFLNSDYVEFITSDGTTTMNWIGNTLSVNPVDLVQGDEIRVLYLYAEVPSGSQSLEDYIRTLPLIDQRDERSQSYPPKNWNVRVISADDPLFDIIIPNRNPFYDPLIYGKVRTEFPYSENIFNMEEYNGSLRNSNDPCDIDKDFVDGCSSCISSSYNIDLQIENLSDDRIQEAIDVLEEYTPFHAVLHTMNFTGCINEYVQSPTEEIEILVTFYGTENVISGNAQTYFNRIMKEVETYGLLRDVDLSSSSLSTSGSGLAYNNNIIMFCPSMKLEGLGIAIDGSAKLYVKAPSPLAGQYYVDSPDGNTVSLVTSVSEPISDCNSIFDVDGTLNSCAFTFDIENDVLAINDTLCDIVQDNLYKLIDSNQDFSQLDVQSSVDVSEGNASYAWSILISAYSATPYVIYDILPDGSLILEDTGTLPSSTTTVNYELYNNLTLVYSGSAELNVTNRGRVTALDSNSLPVQNIFVTDKVYYQKIFTNEYLISGYPLGTTDQYYIYGYTAGDNSGANITVKQKIVQDQIGYLSHRGLNLIASGNLETSLGIQNGTHSLISGGDVGVENNKFKENFIVKIGTNNYWISQIDGNNPTGYTTINLIGPDVYWKTLNSGGTTVSYEIYKYTKTENITIEGQQFDLPSHTFKVLDRSGTEIITGITSDSDLVMTQNIEEPGNIFTENVMQQEGISYKIEYTDGSVEEGELPTN